MKTPENKPLIQTLGEQCRVCYTCVRECPAKAIRIADGQAEIIADRCIACGNCVRVCSQKAKRVLSSIVYVQELLAAEAPVAAILAPSFPAEFADMSAEQLVGMIRSLGFDAVNEVAFGADLVALEYRKLLASDSDERFIATSCPAIVAYVEKYHPEMVDNLAPIVSPMVAEARVLHKKHGPDMQVVFIGPCIAKKGESLSVHLPDEIAATMTFAELRKMFDAKGLHPHAAQTSAFDGPHPGLGALFPLARGLLQAADVPENLMAGDVVAADGRNDFTAAIKEFASGDMDTRLLEVLCCNGCIMGAGMTSTAPLFSRRSQISRYVRRQMGQFSQSRWQDDLAEYADVNLLRNYAPNDQRIPVPFEDEIRLILARMGKHRGEDELNCGACGYETCREHAVAIFKGLAETEMCLPNTIEKLNITVGQLAETNQRLASTQEALVQSEKLASMGQLAAGIAHEVNNPLGVVLMYSHLLLDDTPDDAPAREDLQMIATQADRCKKIVAGLLDFARQNKVHHAPTHLEDLVAKVLDSAPPPEKVTVAELECATDPVAEVDRDQIVQVVTNLVTNAYGAMETGGTLTVWLDGDETNVNIHVADTGCGIPRENRKKIFEPFFTTKLAGKGTGLGLAVIYGIVKMHRGDVHLQSNDDPNAGPTGTTFTITLPRKHRRE